MSQYSFGIAYEDEYGDYVVEEVEGFEPGRRLQQLYRLRGRAEHFELNDLTDILSGHIELLCAGDFDEELFVVDEEIRLAEMEITLAEINYDKNVHLSKIRSKERKDKWNIEDHILAGANWLKIVRRKQNEYHPNWPKSGEKPLAAPLEEATPRPRLGRPGLSDQTKAKKTVLKGLGLIAAEPDSSQVQSVLKSVFEDEYPEDLLGLLERAQAILK